MSKYVMPNDERERLKRDAWVRYRDAANISIKASAIEDVILAHFERSREFIRNHPKYETFAAHWLHVRKDDPWFPGAKNDPDYYKVVELLIKKYGVPKKPRIGVGRSYWGTA